MGEQEPVWVPKDVLEFVRRYVRTDAPDIATLP
jgi:hypothetical protein